MNFSQQEHQQLQFEDLPPEIRQKIFKFRRLLLGNDIDVRLRLKRSQPNTNILHSYQFSDNGFTWMTLNLAIKWDYLIDVEQMLCRLCHQPVGCGPKMDHYIFSKTEGLTIYYNHKTCEEQLKSLPHINK